MKVYLASRWERREEMARYRDELISMGIEVVSTWMSGPMEEWSLHNGMSALEHGRSEAVRDADEVGEADLVVNFTEDPTTAWVRGGRHWECGYSYALGIDQLLVGPREIVFHCLAHMNQVDTWEEAKDYIREYQNDQQARGT